MIYRGPNFRTRRRRGFTLVEAALTTVIVGLGVLATMSLFAACSQENMSASEMTTAMELATNIQEAMANMAFADPIKGTTNFGPETGETLSSYNDVDDFDGKTINPPIDSLRNSIPTMSQYSQVIAVDPVDPNQMSVTLPKTITNRTAVRVTVRILYTKVTGGGSEEVYRTTWVRTSE
jgi:type II secretory pathway pseudopilin PulG